MHASAVPSPWEEGSDSDADEPVNVAHHRNQQVKPPRPTSNLNFTQFYQNIDAPPTLYALCIELLAANLPVVIDLGNDTLQCLPPTATAALLAIARRTNTLTNRVLAALTDARWDALDLAYTPHLTDRCVRDAPSKAPSHVHQGHSPLPGGRRPKPTLPRPLPKPCKPSNPHRPPEPLSPPRSRPSRCDATSTQYVLRTKPCITLGGTPESDERALGALPSLLPRPAALLSPAVDDWEQDPPPEPPEASHHPRGGLPSLQCICWPQAPSAAMSMVQRRAPWVAVNPLAARGMRVGLPAAGPPVPPEAVLEVPLDQRWLWGVRPRAWDGDRAPADEARLSLPIAQRFRLAYEEVAMQRVRRRRRHHQQDVLR